MKWLRWLLPVATLWLLAFVIIWHEHIWWWIEVHTGTVNEPGPYYGFFSGFGSDLSEVALFGAVLGLLRKHNCEVQGCWRLSRHTTDGGHHVCARHMPGGAPSHSEVIAAHDAARTNTSET